jgi:hypothetical protein
VASANVRGDVAAESRPEICSVNELGGFPDTWVTAKFMIVVVAKDFEAEVVMIGDIDFSVS